MRSGFDQRVLDHCREAFEDLQLCAEREMSREQIFDALTRYYASEAALDALDAQDAAANHIQSGLLYNLSLEDPLTFESICVYGHTCEQFLDIDSDVIDDSLKALGLSEDDIEDIKGQKRALESERVKGLIRKVGAARTKAAQSVTLPTIAGADRNVNQKPHYGWREDGNAADWAEAPQNAYLKKNRVRSGSNTFNHALDKFAESVGFVGANRRPSSFDPGDFYQGLIEAANWRPKPQKRHPLEGSLFDAFRGAAGYGG
jgi:hypothetical protein